MNEITNETINETLLLLGLIFSSIGFGYFMYGRRKADLIIRYTGIALMIYPYFFDDVRVVLGIGIGLLFLPKIAQRFY